MELCTKFEYNGTNYVILNDVPDVSKVSLVSSPRRQAQVMDGTPCKDFLSVPFLDDVEVEEVEGGMYVKGTCEWEGTKYFIDTKLYGRTALTEEEYNAANEPKPEPESEVELELESEPEVEQEQEVEVEPEVEPMIDPEVESMAEDVGPRVEPEVEPVVEDVRPRIAFEPPKPEVEVKPQSQIKFVFGRKGRPGARIGAHLSHHDVKVPIVKPQPSKIEAPKIEAPKVEIPKVEIPKVETPVVEAPVVETPKVAPTVEIESEVEPVEIEEAPVLYKDTERYSNAASPNLVPPTTLEDVHKMIEEEADEEAEVELEEAPEEEDGFPSWAYELPKKVLKNIKSFTNKNVDLEALQNMGMDYCNKNKWYIRDDVAYIDEIPTKSTIVYNSTYEEYIKLSYEQKRELIKLL